MVLATENGSKEANAAPKPTIFPFASFVTGRGCREDRAGLVFWLTRADHDFGGGRGVGVGLLVGEVASEEDCDCGVDLAGVEVYDFGMAGERGDVGDVIVGVGIMWFGASLRPAVEAFEEEGGRELVTELRIRAACFLCHRRLFGNGLLGSETHGV